MDAGLWRYTRHPNYFGRLGTARRGFYLFALAVVAGWSIISPLLMTWLLLRVSGVALLEKDISERRPAYRSHIARTNAFIPGPPRGAWDSTTGAIAMHRLTGLTLCAIPPTMTGSAAASTETFRFKADLIETQSVSTASRSPQRAQSSKSSRAPASTSRC